MRLVSLISLFIASQTLLHPVTVFAQAAQGDRCGASILYDSADGPVLMDIGERTTRPVFRELGGEGFDVIKPHLSPDGRTLAWVRNSRDPGIGPAIWLLDIATGDQKSLVSDLNSDQPAWSPDGMRIAFTSWQRRPGGLIGDIYVIDADGENLHRLTDNEFRDEFATWSPDGMRIAFGSSRNGNFDIFVMQSDGSDVQQLTTHPAADFRPSWSPDGRWLAFSSSRHDYRERDSYKYDIYVMRPDGTQVRRITQHTLLALRPSWSPTGDMMVYQVGGAALDGSDWEIYAVGVEGGSPQRLTNNSVSDAHPDWNTFMSGCRQQ